MIPLIIIGFTVAGLLLFTITFVIHLFSLVPYVPTAQRTVAKMIEAAELEKGDKVYDLGCGDGRLLFAAEKATGLGGTGCEIAPAIYLLALVRKLLSRSRAVIRFQNLFSADLSGSNVIFCYLIPDVMPRLAEKLKRECRPGTRIISNTFHIPGLNQSKCLEKDLSRGLPTVYVYAI